MSTDKQIATAAATVGRGQRAKPEPPKAESKPEVPVTSPENKERE